MFVPQSGQVMSSLPETQAKCAVWKQSRIIISSPYGDGSACPWGQSCPQIEHWSGIISLIGASGIGALALQIVIRDEVQVHGAYVMPCIPRCIVSCRSICRKSSSSSF